MKSLYLPIDKEQHHFFFLEMALSSIGKRCPFDTLSEIFLGPIGIQVKPIMVSTPQCCWGTLMVGLKDRENIDHAFVRK